MARSIQNAVADMTEAALEGFIKSIRRMPADKLTWLPLDQGRTALDQFQECATAPIVYRSRLLGTPFVIDREARKSWNVDETERHARQATAELVAVIRDTSDDRLDEVVKVPWGTMSVLEVVWMHYWNLTYHLGAVNHIQTLYGDLED
jgi:hypothetical protein